MQILNNKLLRDSEAFHFNVLLYCHIFSNFNFLSSYEIGTGTWSDSDKKNSGQQG